MARVAIAAPASKRPLVYRFSVMSGLEVDNVRSLVPTNEVQWEAKMKGKRGCLPRAFVTVPTTDRM